MLWQVQSVRIIRTTVTKISVITGFIFLDKNGFYR